MQDGEAMALRCHCDRQNALAVARRTLRWHAPPRKRGEAAPTEIKRALCGLYLAELARPLSRLRGHGQSQERRKQSLHFKLRGNVRQGRPRAERALVEIVERRQSPRVELAEDDAFGETFDATEAKLLRKLVQCFSDELFIARIEV